MVTYRMPCWVIFALNNTNPIIVIGTYSQESMQGFVIIGAKHGLVVAVVILVALVVVVVVYLI